MIFLALSSGDYVTSGQRTPFELRKFLSGLVLQADLLLDIVDAKLIYDWCTAATQVSAKRNSLLTIYMYTLSNTELVFSKWKADRVDSTLGELKTPSHMVQHTALPATQLAAAQTIMTATGQGQQPNTGMSQNDMWVMMGATLGQSITTAMKPIAEATLAAAKRKKADEEKGKIYNLYEIHLFMGWSGVSNTKNLPSI